MTELFKGPVGCCARFEEQTSRNKSWRKHFSAEPSKFFSFSHSCTMFFDFFFSLSLFTSTSLTHQPLTRNHSLRLLPSALCTLLTTYVIANPQSNNWQGNSNIRSAKQPKGNREKAADTVTSTCDSSVCLLCPAFKSQQVRERERWIDPGGDLSGRQYCRKWRQIKAK